jgi:hypothetical protein
MGPADLASASHTGGGSAWLLVLGLIFIVFAIPAVVFPVLTVVRRRGPTIKGPALTGTAQIVWARPSMNSPNLRLIPLYKIALRVELAGREPYDVIIWQPVPRRVPYNNLRGAVTVDVQADNPKKVRIVADAKGRWYA